MSATVPYNRATSHFEPQVYPVALSSFMDEATFRESIGRLNTRVEQVGKNHVGRTIGIFLAVLCLFVAGWVLFGVGLGISNMPLVIAGIVIVIVSIFIGSCVAGIISGKQRLALHAGVAAENERFKNNQPPISFRLAEQYISNWNGSYHDSRTEYTLFIEVGKPFQQDNQTIKQTNNQTNQVDQPETSKVGSGPASQTVNDAPAHDFHSIHIVHPAKII